MNSISQKHTESFTKKMVSEADTMASRDKTIASEDDAMASLDKTMASDDKTIATLNETITPLSITMTNANWSINSRTQIDKLFLKTRSLFKKSETVIEYI